ncbi:nitrile hydratase subunit beta [Alphaproteobacteria bacterium]|nr:nitrile hydratase subunit beta [Alphaproteobacteria bacterium]MDC0461781.1 nitrile hydratase subunit beta [Alphaproteobacteria bacterium]
MSYNSRASSNPKYTVNQNIVISRRGSEGHCRTPSYIRGKTGRVERYCGNFRNPEQLAENIKDADIIPLYRCVFYQHDIWSNYLGSKNDTLELEIYEHWIEPA